MLLGLAWAWEAGEAFPGGGSAVSIAAGGAEGFVFSLPAPSSFCNLLVACKHPGAPPCQEVVGRPWTLLMDPGGERELNIFRLLWSEGRGAGGQQRGMVSCCMPHLAQVRHLPGQHSTATPTGLSPCLLSPGSCWVLYTNTKLQTFLPCLRGEDSGSSNSSVLPKSSQRDGEG